ncbi:YfhO family protein [Flavobacteriaceae bacterium TK19130]|nr:YfhO family protein [Thermobacterium salinum]
MAQSLKKLVPHIIVLTLFVLAALVYFNPVLQGKTIFQSDIVQYQGMAKQLKDYRAETGEETYWIDNAFGGMPTYQLGAKYPHNYIKDVDGLLRFLPRPADYLFLYFLGFYILLLILKLDYKYAFLGALAFGFSTYLIIILGVGHNAKAHAIAYMPMVLAGILLTFRGKYLYGFLLTTIAMGLELAANHFQMTYYLLLLVICVGIAYFIDAVKKKLIPHYLKALGIMVVAVVIALGLNATNLLATKEYADTSTRGQSELTITPNGAPKDNTDGLDYDYITEYSYGIVESFNLLVPNFMGGGSSDALPTDSETYEALVKMGAGPQNAAQIVQQLPTYWGDQPIVAAPAYVGAIVVFLALLGIILVKGRLRWWLLSAFLLSLFLSWGENLEWLTQLFIDVVPLYNKFRAVSSIQVILELVLPIMAVFGIYKFLNEFTSEDEKKKALYWSGGIVGGLCLLFLVGSSLFDFASPYDPMIREQLGIQVMDALREDRASLMTSDALRSLLLVLGGFVTLWLASRQKLKTTPAIGVLTVLLLIDLVGVDRRYVNNDDFVAKRVMEQPFQENAADDQILQENPEGHYRVYDAAGGGFNSGRASYFHKSVGGYHAAKPGRMKDLNDFYISQGNIGILNMLNVRYIIVPSENGRPFAQRNPYANGNAWFVENVKLVDSANEELLQLDSLNTKTTAVIHSEFKDILPTQNVDRDSTATIELVNYAPDHLVYESSSTSPQLAVFSEVYYPHGWKVLIDGTPAEYYRANYALRAMTVPAGNHKIEFKFKPQVISTGGSISLISSILFGLLVIGGIWVGYRNRSEVATN